jgi:hypothetical protein
VSSCVRSRNAEKKAPAVTGAKLKPETKKGSPAARTAARSKRFR